MFFLFVLLFICSCLWFHLAMRLILFFSFCFALLFSLFLSLLWIVASYMFLLVKTQIRDNENKTLWMRFSFDIYKSIKPVAVSLACFFFQTKKLLSFFVGLFIYFLLSNLTLAWKHLHLKVCVSLNVHAFGLFSLDFTFKSILFITQKN